jgi:hypothetical protein
MEQIKIVSEVNRGRIGIYRFAASTAGWCRTRMDYTMQRMMTRVEMGGDWDII